jgi:hypothetical protein
MLIYVIVKFKYVIFIYRYFKIPRFVLYNTNSFNIKNTAY